MSYQNIKSDLLVELSTDEQQLLSGGQKPGKKHKPIICYEWKEYRDHDEDSTKSDDGDDD